MNNIRIIKQYFKIYKTDKKCLCLLFFTSFMANAPYMFTSLIWSLFIKYLLQRDITNILIISIIYFSLKIISRIFNALNLNAQRKFYNAAYSNFQTIIIGKLENINPDVLDSQKKANILNVANVDIKILADFGDWLVHTLLSLIGFVVSIFILSQVSIWYMIYAIIINMIMILLLDKYNQKYEKIMKDTKDKIDSEIGFFNQIVNGIGEIKIFNIQSQIRGLYKNKNDAYIKEHNKQIQNNILRKVISPMISMISEMLTFSYFIYGFLQNILTIDTILLLHTYFGEMFSNLNSFVDKLNSLRVIGVSIDRYQQFINEKNDTIVYGENSNQDIKGDIQFENVSFGYNESLILKSVNFNISSNLMTAIIGESGSGKSTIFSLLLRFYKPSEGRILLDDIDLYDFNQETYSHNLSIVKQDSFMFNMSIYDNLALINANKDEIIAICKKVYLHDFIMELPNGYDTVIKEGALDLSGGQRQRLSIARTLLKKSKILLLDEITSALNKKLSDEIFDLLEELKQDHTIVMITHKEEEANKCDTILEVKNGTVKKLR